jgi:Right handed beta helix region
MRCLFKIALGLAVALLAFAPTALGGTTFVVDDDGTDCPNADFTSIQAAVTAAPAGARIEVCAGTYNEEVVIAPPKNHLSLVAKGPLGAVVVDGEDTMEHGFLLTGGVTGVLVEGFVVQRYHDDIVLSDAEENVIRGNETRFASEHDGIELFSDAHRNLIEHNVAHDNLQTISCGISAGGGSSDNVISHNVVFHNANNGILLGGGLLGPAGTGNVIEHNFVFDNGEPVSGANRGTGILNAITPGSTIRLNQVTSNNAFGISVTGATSTGVTVEHNFVESNGSTTDDDGIRIQGAPNALVRYNDSRLNRHDGVHLLAAVNAVVEHNVLDENGTPGVGNGCGIDVDGGSTGSVVRHNIARGQSRAGYRIRNSIGNEVSENNAKMNPGDGIQLTNGDANLVESNRSGGNGSDGLHADAASAGNTIRGNTMIENAEFDCRDDSVGAGTAGTANFWIDDKGRTENRPGLCEHGKS